MELVPGHSMKHMIEQTKLKLKENVVSRKCKEILNALYYL